MQKEAEESLGKMKVSNMIDDKDYIMHDCIIHSNFSKILVRSMSKS